MDSPAVALHSATQSECWGTARGSAWRRELTERRRHLCYALIQPLVPLPAQVRAPRVGLQRSTSRGEPTPPINATAPGLACRALLGREGFLPFVRHDTLRARSSARGATRACCACGRSRRRTSPIISLFFCRFMASQQRLPASRQPLCLCTLEPHPIAPLRRSTAPAARAAALVVTPQSRRVAQRNCQASGTIAAQREASGGSPGSIQVSHRDRPGATGTVGQQRRLFPLIAKSSALQIEMAPQQLQSLGYLGRIHLIFTLQLIIGRLHWRVEVESSPTLPTAAAFAATCAPSTERFAGPRAPSRAHCNTYH